MKSAVVVFPGSNCDQDMFDALQLLGHRVEFVWHKEGNLDGYDFVVLPGGFSYGDYLRAGAVARFSPIMAAVVRHAGKGKPLLGICNGFQILTEAGLLPGALLRNEKLRFICRYVFVRTENNQTLFTRHLKKKQVLKLPIAHGEGNYFIGPQGLKALQDNNQIVFRYATASGEISRRANPNGSMAAIAGIINRKGNVLGMMPHPERAVETILGSEDGRKIFASLTA